MGQLRFPRHEYVKFLRTERLKNDLQPINKERDEIKLNFKLLCNCARGIDKLNANYRELFYSAQNFDLWEPSKTHIVQQKNLDMIEED